MSLHADLSRADLHGKSFDLRISFLSPSLWFLTKTDGKSKEGKGLSGGKKTRRKWTDVEGSAKSKGNRDLSVTADAFSVILTIA